MRRGSLAVLILTVCSTVKADLALLLHESTGKGVSSYTSAGHSAVYLSNVCMATPVRMRLCEAGEEGSVVANYTSLGENQPYEWNVAPLSYYLYGVARAEDAPLYATKELRALLQENYRKKFLEDVCPAETCGAATTEAHWRDMVGSTFDRDIYAFRVKTTREQDQQIVDEFNAMPNVNRYNGFTRNCADFARLVVNRYFPGAARPDHLNDFGMTSPKAISKSFAHYGRAHPELDYSVEKISQLPGPIRRSMDCRKGTEVGFRAKRWFLPLAWMMPHELAFFAGSYFLTGRFNPEHEYEDNPAPEVAELEAKKAVAAEAEKARLNESIQAERESRVGSARIWRDYKGRFAPIVAQAIQDGVFRDRAELQRYLKDLEKIGRPELDESGAPRLVTDSGAVGLTRRTILSRESDRGLAYKLMLARVHAELAAPWKNREALPEFESDWEILTRLRGETRAARSGAAGVGGGQE